MVFNRLTEKFTVEGVRLTEQQRYDLRVAGITLLMWGSFVYILDSTHVGYWVGTHFWGLQADDNSLDFTTKKASLAGDTPAVVDIETATVPVDTGEQTQADVAGSDETGNTIINTISIALIVVGLCLVFASYSRQNAGWVMPICALLYTFGFVYLISYIRNRNETGNDKYKYLGVAIILILAGGLIQGLVKDNLEEEFEEQSEEQPE